MSLGDFSSTASLFVDDGTEIAVTNISRQPSPIDSTIAVSADISQFGAARLRSFLKSSPGAGGFLALVHSSSPVVVLRDDSEEWRLVVNWALEKSALSVEELERPKDPAIRNAFDARAAVASALGSPQIVTTPNGYATGWNIQLPSNRAKLNSLLTSSVNVTPRRVANEYSTDAVLLVRNACDELKDHIVNLGTGDTGCGGLTQ